MSFLDFLRKTYDLIQDGEVKSINSICSHSQKVQIGSLFVAIPGKRSDGHFYIKQAVERGASSLFVEDCKNIPNNFKGLILKSSSTQKALSKILNEFYNFPSQKLFTIGVTGTNGKTSVSYLLEHIFKHCGWPAGVIGTVDQHFEEKRWPTGLTTPTSTETFRRLQDFINLGAKACVMEVSSIGLDQKRIEGIDFKAFIFTNLSQDHLDYHESMENYFQSKKKLFLQANQQVSQNLFCLINTDDKYGKILRKSVRTPCYSYGQNEDCDFAFKIKKQNTFNTIFELKTPNGVYEGVLPLMGVFNVYNAVAALSCALLTGFKEENCLEALKKFPGIQGRLQKVSSVHPFEVFIDYAHTPQALSAVLPPLKKKAKNLILVFGCGGDRDKEKRSQMMEEALKFSDKIFFTTDNSRYEDPQKITEQSLKNISTKEKGKIIVEFDRRKAIQKACQEASQGDVVLIAGKGHEKFQIIGDKKIPFCDVTVAEECLKKLAF